MNPIHLLRRSCKRQPGWELPGLLVCGWLLPLSPHEEASPKGALQNAKPAPRALSQSIWPLALQPSTHPPPRKQTVRNSLGFKTEEPEGDKSPPLKKKKTHITNLWKLHSNHPPAAAPCQTPKVGEPQQAGGGGGRHTNTWPHRRLPALSLIDTFGQAWPQKRIKSLRAPRTGRHQALPTVICQLYNSSIDKAAATGFDKCAGAAFHSKPG